MKLGIVKRILKDDLARSGDLPSWIDQLLQPLNDVIEKVGLALQNRLTFSENFLCKTISQKFASGTEYEINPTATGQSIKLKPTGVLLLNPGGGLVSSFGWYQKTNGNIGVTISFSNVSSATCSILILLG
jgi:hypothetical protein